MDTAAAQRLLNAHGFPCGAADGVAGQKTRAAVARFQQAYNGPGGWLTVDGIAGPKTSAALDQLPNLSANFTAAEMACHHCGQAYVRRDLLAALETLRQVTGPIRIVSGYRCPEHNRAVGGAKQSQHVIGAAADPLFGRPITVAHVVALAVFSGIGDKDGTVRHVDVRHLSPDNPTPHATPAAPARWHY